MVLSLLQQLQTHKESSQRPGVTIPPSHQSNAWIYSHLVKQILCYSLIHIHTHISFAAEFIKRDLDACHEENPFSHNDDWHSNFEAKVEGPDTANTELIEKVRRLEAELKEKVKDAKIAELTAKVHRLETELAKAKIVEKREALEEIHM